MFFQVSAFVSYQKDLYLKKSQHRRKWILQNSQLSVLLTSKTQKVPTSYFSGILIVSNIIGLYKGPNIGSFCIETSCLLTLTRFSFVSSCAQRDNSHSRPLLPTLYSLHRKLGPVHQVNSLIC